MTSWLSLNSNRLPYMAALLLKAQLVNQAGVIQAEFARILFGVDSPDNKEKTFRAICKTTYPHLRIQEPPTPEETDYGFASALASLPEDGVSELIQAAIFSASALGTCGMGGISVA